MTNPTGPSTPQPIHAGHDAPRHPLTLRDLAAMAQRAEPFACLTCYDATTARLLERAGVHLLLVGDTAAEVILGFPNTVHMPLDLSIALTAAVKRGAPNTVVMGDMPFLTYHTSEADALRNAARYLTDANADIVKLEADASFAPLIAAMSRAGIPVCAHVGSRPQRALLAGGYAAAGRTAEEARQIVEDAVALERAGAVMLLVEAVPDQVTDAILARTRVPLIGIGAGTRPHAQVLVIHDLLGLTDNPPRFAQPAANLAPAFIDAARQWVRRVADRDLGGQRYHMRAGEAERFTEHTAPRSPSDPTPPRASTAPAGR